MRNHAEVQARIRGILVQEIDRRMAEAQQRLPHRCSYNHRQALDSRKAVEGEPNAGYNRVDRRHLPVVGIIGLCMLGSEDPYNWNGTICDDVTDAQHCPTFAPLQTREQIIEDFKTQLADYDWVEANIPALHALLWVLEDIPANYHLPWWKRLLLRFLRIRIEPVKQRNVLQLLPPGGTE
jgi:hypothetical protein